MTAPDHDPIGHARRLVFGTGYEVVTRTELAALRADSRRLSALETGGVDNWGGYDDAIAAMHNDA